MLKRVWLILFGLLCLPIYLSMNAFAKELVKCEKVGDFYLVNGHCSLYVNSGNVVKGGSAQMARPLCQRNTDSGYKEVDCSFRGSWWSNQHQCYVNVAEPQPPMSDPIWQDRSDGTIFYCWDFNDNRSRFNDYFWAQTSRTDPSVLARRAVERMELRAPVLKMMPPLQSQYPDSIAWVGLNVWMWQTDIGEHTWGPITRSVTSGANTVTATARATHTTWDMGDGHSVVCRTPGSQYIKLAMQLNPKSPSCGYQYQIDGYYTVRATTHWKVEWSGMGQRGVFNTSVSRSTPITVAELHTLIVPDR